MTDEPEVIIKHDNYEMKKVQKERKVEEEVKMEGVKNNYELGMKVSWMKGDIKKTGTIKELKAKGAVIEEDETGKKQRKSFKQLTIEDQIGPSHESCE